MARLVTSRNDSPEGARDSMSANGQPEVAPRDIADTIRRRTVAVHARHRGAEVLREIAFDIVGIERDSTALRDRVAISQLLDQPINEATEAALSVLVAELLAAIEGAPHGLKSAIVFSSISRTDFEQLR